MPLDIETPARTGLLLTGGGARAAYQVGVLEAIADIRKECCAHADPNPFPIITGTSAGAINAAALACGADDFDAAVRRIVEVWRNFHVHQVYRSDSLGVIRTGASWLTLLSLGWLLAKWRRLKPRSLLDNTPLHALLRDMVPLERLPELIAQYHAQQDVKVLLFQHRPCHLAIIGALDIVTLPGHFFLDHQAEILFVVYD